MSVVAGERTRCGRTVRQLAARWGVSEAVARGFLRHFARRGLAVESDGLWYATPLARRRFRFLSFDADEWDG